MKKTPKLRFKEFGGEWESKKIGDISNIYDGTHQTPKYTDKGIKFVSVENINDIYKGNKYISEEEYNNNFKIKPQINDIFMTRITAGEIGATAIVNKEEALAYYVSVALIRPDSKKVNSYFLTKYISNKYFKRELNKRIIHVAFPKKINLGDIGECGVYLSRLEEQEKIASFFSLIDEKIHKQQKKVEALEEYRKGMMQKIFSQEIRFKDDNGGEFPEWEEKEFSEFLTSRVQKQVPSQEAPLMAFTATGGIEPKGDRYDRSFLVKSDEKLYKRTELNDFIYSSNNLDVGSIGLNKYGTAVISDVYEIFIINKEVSYNFISELIKTPKVMNKIISYRQGVMYGQYRIHAEDFLKIKEFIPCLEEQQKINKLLCNIDKLLYKEKEKLQQLNQWEKGLLQHMFI